MNEEKHAQYARAAGGWSDDQYADAGTYLTHRAWMIDRLGAPLRPGDVVLDLAAGDGGLAPHLLRRGLRYHGVDLTPEMIATARNRLGTTVSLDVGDLNAFAPHEPVAATTLFRALYYVDDRPAFFARVRDFTRRKLVLDVNPRQYDLATIVGELGRAGFGTVAKRPFFVPQTQRLPPGGLALARAAERVGPLARAVLRARFTVVVAALVSDRD